MSANNSAGETIRSDYFFGWDLLYRTIESQVNKKADILLALAHFVLVKHYSFKCIGLGEDKTISEDEIGSELLPTDWNDGDEKYALRYVSNGQLYILLGHMTEDCLIINLLHVGKKNVSNIGLDPEELVKNTKGSIATMLPGASQIVDRFRKELLDPVFSGNTREVTTQTATTTTTTERLDPLRIGEPMRPRRPLIPAGVGGDPYAGPDPFGLPGVGRGDLDPLGRGGSGNLFPFPSHPDFRVGPHPAAPRFDPYNPPERNIRPNPNPDHLQPPNYGGFDYYM